MRKIYSIIMGMAMGLTAMAQTDVTYKIENASFEDGADGWTIEGLVPQTNASFKQKDGNVYMEKWVSSGNSVGNASAKQALKGLVKGKYQLSAAAQNIQQNKSDAQTGVYIWAKTTSTKTDVTAAGTYTLDFDLLTSTTNIGFAAVNASGNWISLDNFKLTFVSVEPATVTSLLTSANSQLEKKLNDTNINALKAAIDEAQKAVDEGKEDLTGVCMKLNDALEAAKENTKAYTTLKTLVSKAKLILNKKMGNAELDALNKAIESAVAAQETTDNDPVALTETLQKAYDDANTSITNYKSLNDAAKKAEDVYDESKKGAETFLADVTKAKNMYEEGTANNETILAMIDYLAQAKFEFQLNNATEGTGKAPAVTLTNHHVLTGATEALMRATFSGDNILEKGVCWAKNNNPTVFDNRTTKSFSLNGTIIHVKGLEPGTVYYLRPYIINKTYQLAMGDVVKIVTHPAGTCSWSWAENGPDAATNDRCREAVKTTIDYFNEWTGIKGFHLSGNYAHGAGAGGGTADCSYGGYMRISQNTAYQAIGTVLHETGHGVGVGTHPRYSDENVHSWKWYGREANRIYSFLENKEADPYNSDFSMVGDGTHAWGSSASYDWFVNGADKDKHTELQYIGGCCLLYGMFIDGLDPTSSEWWTTQHNGIAGYTYNFDDDKRYYIMNKDADRGLNETLLSMNGTRIEWTTAINETSEIPQAAAWFIEYEPSTGLYAFRNAETGKYISHSSAIGVKTVTTGKKPSTSEYFQLMPDRTDVTIGSGAETLKTHGYWFTWTASGFKSISADAKSASLGYGKASAATFDYSDKATKQQWIIISEDELAKYWNASLPDAIKPAAQTSSSSLTGIYSLNGTRLQSQQKGINILRYSDGSTKKIMVK